MNYNTKKYSTLGGIFLNIEITDKAVEWFRQELDAQQGDNIQFFVKYGGSGDFQTGFSLGVQMKEPEEIAVISEKAGMKFYIEGKDIWYFDNQDLLVDYDEETSEIKYVKK